MWGRYIANDKRFACNLPIPVNRVLYASIIDVVGEHDTEATLNANIQLANRSNTTVTFVSQEILFTVSYIAIGKISN